VAKWIKRSPIQAKTVGSTLILLFCLAAYLCTEGPEVETHHINTSFQTVVGRVPPVSAPLRWGHEFAVAVLSYTVQWLYGICVVSFPLTLTLIS